MRLWLSRQVPICWNWSTRFGAWPSSDGPATKSLKSGWSIAKAAYTHYRALVDDPGFLNYFDQATPISEIENLPIGSRPSRRRARRSLADLRAIPWTFAWTQSRHLIPAWYGLGTAVDHFIRGGGENLTLLRHMYQHWAHFRAYVDNAELALAKADVAIAHRYANLAGDHDPSSTAWFSNILQDNKLRRGGRVLALRSAMRGGVG